MSEFVPDRFDIVFMNMEPQSGTEIKKRRPCLVLSTAEFNKRTSLAFICPITTSAPKSNAQIILPNQKTRGAILIDQLRSVDWRSRNAVKTDVLKDKTIYTHLNGIVNQIIMGSE